MKVPEDDLYAPVLATGICGSGKTYALQRLAADAVRTGAHRVVVLDTGHQWPGEPSKAKPIVRYGLARSAAGVERALAAGESYVVARLARPLEDVSAAPLRGHAEALAAIVAAAGGAVLILPEVHLSEPNAGRLSPHVGRLVHEYRHVRAGVWGDTQHWRDLHTELRNAARLVCVHATDSRRDLAVLADEYDPALLPLLEEALQQRNAGKPGYRVELHRGHRRPPYKLVR